MRELLIFAAGVLVGVVVSLWLVATSPAPRCHEPAVLHDDWPRVGEGER